VGEVAAEGGEEEESLSGSLIVRLQHCTEYCVWSGVLFLYDCRSSHSGRFLVRGAAMLESWTVLCQTLDLEWLFAIIGVLEAVDVWFGRQQC
jgi:hypothetical protein